MTSKSKQNIEILTCPEAPALHHITYGFFTRNGGVSKAPYDSLNVGLGSDDVLENIIENRARAADSFGSVTEESLCTLYQIHSNKVVVVDKPFSQDERPEGDAMVTTQAGIMLGILTADCGPVLFADQENKVIGGAHAGWKGAVSGVLENTISKMEEIGAKKEHITAFLGPCIHQESYEVDKVFKQTFLDLAKEYEQFFIDSKERQNHYQFNLPDFIKHLLKQTGINVVHQLALDTYNQETNFFSFRRNTHQNIVGYGRGLSAIMINK